MPLPRSIASQARDPGKEVAGSKGMGGFSGRSGEIPHCRQEKVLQEPDTAPVKGNKRLAARFYQLKTGHCLTGQ